MFLLECSSMILELQNMLWNWKSSGFFFGFCLKGLNFYGLELKKVVKMTQSPQSSETGPLFSKLENKRTNLTIRESRTKITTKLNCPPDYFFLSKSNRNETNPQSYKTGLLFSKLESKRTNLTIRGSQTKITTKLCVLLILVISFFSLQKE